MIIGEKTIDAKIKSISEGMSFIKDALSDAKVTSKDSNKAQLVAEEFLAHIISAKAEEDSTTIRIVVTKRGRGCKILISFAGKKIDNLENVGLGVDLSEGEMSPDTEAVIRKTIISALEDKYSVGYRNGVNKITITVGEAGKNEAMVTAGAFILAIIVGLILRLLVPADISSAINKNVFEIIKTIFLNALKLITGPVVFLAIASCVSTFSDMKELGKTAVKVLAFYVFTSVVAIAVGVVFMNLWNPGTPGELLGMYSGEVVEAQSINFMDSFLQMIPSNLISPFLELNTIQIIIMALLLGIGAAKMGDKSQRFADALHDLNNLFLKITGIILKFLPLMIFSSIASLITTIDFGNLTSLLWVTVCALTAFCAMMLIYIIIVFVTTGTNPVKYFKSVFPAWFNAFILQSSNASMPYTMEVCRDNLRISPKVYSFSIPLGATINMDGFTIGLTVWTLFFIKAFGIQMSISEYIPLFFSILVLCMGAPGIPGAGSICMGVIMAQAGIPQAALSIFISMYVILEPLETSNNVFGDITGTYVIAKRSGLVQKA